MTILNSNVNFDKHFGEVWLSENAVINFSVLSLLSVPSQIFRKQLSLTLTLVVQLQVIALFIVEPDIHGYSNGLQSNGSRYVSST